MRMIAPESTLPRRRVAAWPWALLWLLAGVALADVPYVTVEPREPWRADRWPVVLALAGQTDDLAAVRESFSRLTRTRGALLVVAQADDEASITSVLENVARDFPVRLDATVLAARGDLAEWARAMVLKQPGSFIGLLSIDAPGTTPLPSAIKPGGLRAALLVVDPGLQAAARQLANGLRRLRVPCALEQIAAAELNRYLGAALSQLLPPPPALTSLDDPVTHARLQAVPGWEFARHDNLLAVARPAGDGGGPRVDIASGLLGRRSFDEYVQSTSDALHTDGIELLESTAVTAPDLPVMAHAFYFLDHRVDPAQAVYWVLVGSGARVVSFRGVGSPAEMAAQFDQVRQLALSVSFEEENAKGAGNP